MISAVDANVLLDVAGNSPLFYGKSVELLEKHSASGSLVICPVVYSELLVFFLRKHDKKYAVHMMEKFLTDIGVTVSDFVKQDFVLAAEAWLGFLGTKGTVQCPKCGVGNNLTCKQCHSPLFWKNHVLSDFLIGAHAQNHANVLLSRDRGYYKKYFTVKILP